MPPAYAAYSIAHFSFADTPRRARHHVACFHFRHYQRFAMSRRSSFCFLPSPAPYFQEHAPFSFFLPRLALSSLTPTSFASPLVCRTLLPPVCRLMLSLFRRWARYACRRRAACWHGVCRVVAQAAPAPTPALRRRWFSCRSRQRAAYAYAR